METDHVQEGRATLGAGHLHTPQEPVHHSFTHDTHKSADATPALPVQTQSPPVSPEEQAASSFALSASRPSPDPPLFPDSAPRESPAPLFDSHVEPLESPSPRRSLSQDEELRHRFSEAAEPSGQLRVPGTRIMIDATPEAARQYYLDQVAEARRIRAAQRAAGRLPFPTHSNVHPRDPNDERTVRSFPISIRTAARPTAVSRPRAPPVRPPRTPMLREAEETAPRDATPPKRGSRAKTPRKTSLNFYNDAFPSESDKKHKRAAPSKRTATKESDLRWRELPDYAPPISSLDHASAKLWSEWHQGPSPMDIHDEQDREHLHPAEQKVAEVLRLRPVQYLANKRRIFDAKVQSLRDGKTFTKTAAQGVTNIDVNKASRIWEAFERVGWFDKKWFEQYLRDD